MRSFQTLISIGLIAMLSACGGGGGNASAPNGSTDGSTGKTLDTRISVAIQSASGVSVQSVPVSGGGQIVATLVDSSGAALASQTLKVTETGTSLLSFPNGTTVTTDSKGVAKIQVNRKSGFSFGIGTFTVQFDAPSCSTSGGNTCYAASTTTTDFRVSPPALTLSLLDAGLPTDTVSTSGATVRAVLRYEDGTPVAKQAVDFAGDLQKISFSDGANSALTDATGVATIKIAKATVTVSGASRLNASATLTGTDINNVAVTTVVTATPLDFSLGKASGAAVLTLSNLDVGVTSLPAYGTRSVTVQANLGEVISPTPVSVTFSSNCGQVSPKTATTNASGIATVSFSATDVAGTSPSTLGCSGKTVEITASAVGADVVRKSLSVLATPEGSFSLAFVVPADPTKSRIYLANSGGPTQTTIQFLLTNSQGEAVPSRDIRLTLKSTNTGTPKATFGSAGNVDPFILTTDSVGKVSVPVYSGTVPTSVMVNAALVSNSAIQTDSSVVAIASGRPTQSSLSLSLGKFSIRGYNFDGEETTVTMSMADRQGNPVPDGTVINFVTESGLMVPATCTTGAVPGDSRCSVKIRSQGSRPVDGRVSILAYAPGEEDFVDTNFNNVYDCGEPFTDLGTAFRSNAALVGGVPAGGAYVSGAFVVPRSASVSACVAGTTPSPTAGDGVWGSADVRQQAVIVFATDDIKATGATWTTGSSAQWTGSVTTQLSVSVSDLNNNSVPTGSGIAAAAIDATQTTPTDGTAFGTCTLVGVSNDSVPNSLGPLPVAISLKDCVSGDQVKLTVTTPYLTKAFTFIVP
jgi:hypothetical protein